MLHMKSQLLHFAQVLEVLRHSESTTLHLNRKKLLSKNLVIKVAIAILAQVTSSLVNILNSPEGTVGNVNIESESGGWSSNRRLWVTKPDRGVNSTHSLNDIVKSGSLLTTNKEGSLDGGILVGWPHTHRMIQEVWILISIKTGAV